MKKHYLTTLYAIGCSLMINMANAGNEAIQANFDTVLKDYRNNPTKFAASEISYYDCEDKTAKHFERIAKTLSRAMAYYYDFRYLLDGENFYSPSQRIIQKVGGADSLFVRLSMEQMRTMSNAILNSLSAEDRQSVKLLLETLRKRYDMVKKIMTPENDKLLRLVEKTVGSINENTLYELGFPKTHQCYSSFYSFNNVSLKMSQDTYFGVSSLDFQLYSFWLRRHRAGTTDKAKQLLDYALSQLSDVTNANTEPKESHLSVAERQSVEAFIAHLKNNEVTALAEKVAYPLVVGKMKINDKQSFIKQFANIFNDTFKQQLIQSNMNRDWSSSGWQGISFRDGDVWLDTDGSLMIINDKDTKRLQPTRQDKEKLHASIAQFNNHQLVAVTKKFKVRIDEVAKDNYRYAAWLAQQSMQEQPDIIINNGKMYLDGARNTHYEFHKGNYTYEVIVTDTGSKKTLPAYLIVRQGTKEIVNQRVKMMEPSPTTTKATNSKDNKSVRFDIIEIALEKLNIDEENNTRKAFIAHKVMPNDPNKTIVVIPQYGKVKDDYFTLHNNTLIIDNQTGEITHQYFESDKTTGWESDAFAINSFTIDTVPYQVSDSEHAFGIVVNKSTHLAATMMEEKNISLFVPTKNSLKKIMTNCETHRIVSGCATSDENFSTNILMLMTKKKTNGYFDIQFKQNKIKTVLNDNCEVKEEKISVQEKISQFTNGHYQCVFNSDE